MAQPIVTFEQVGKMYRRFQALNGVDLTLEKGEIFGFIGPNGAGKTTTLKLITGLLKNFTGKIQVNGLELPEGYGQVHKFTGFLPQSPGFQNWRTVDSALMSLGLLSGVPKDELKAQIGRLLKRFDLEGSRYKKIKSLSGGNTQKVGFVQALLHNPSLVVLDEPLNNLDPSARGEVKQIIRELKQAGVTIIFSSHILSDVEDVADRIGIIQGGKMQFVGTKQALKQHFGVPNDIHLEYAVLPSDLSFLNATQGLEHVDQRTHDKFVLQLTKDADVDAAVDQVIRASLAAGGKLRLIGQFTPSLDELYVRYFERQKEEPKP